MHLSRPTLNDWLTAPADEIAAVVAPHHLALMLSIDGTRRHYLLQTGQTRITDFEDYTLHSAASHVRVYESLFGLGVETILSPILYSLNFLRGEGYLRQAVGSCRSLLLTGAFRSLYERCEVRARLYGDFDLAPQARSTRDDLMSLATTLEQTTPLGQRLLLFGFTAGSFIDEMIARTLRLQADTHQQPDREALRRVCFPHGPSHLDILIGAGWLRVGSILPPVLDGGKTDLYNLSHLALDLPELSARRILYDHLFLRWAGPEDDAEYDHADLEALSAYYQAHQSSVTGLGELIGPGIWYATQG